MNNLPTLKKMNLPSLDVSYGAFDIIGNTIGRFFDYKRDTAMIEYETEKVHAQTEIIIKKIDTELTKALDENEKNYKKEEFRIKIVGKDIKRSGKDRSKIIDAILQSKKPKLVRELRLLLRDENHAFLQKVTLLFSFNTDVKELKGE